MIAIPTRIGRWASSICICDGTTWPSARPSARSPSIQTCRRARKPRRGAALFGQVRGGARVFRSGNGLEPVFSGRAPALPGPSDVPTGPVRRGRRLCSSGDLSATPAPTSRACFWPRATAIWAASTRHARSGRKCSASIPTIPWNTAAKCCPTRTLPISSAWSTGCARPASCNDR